MKKILAMLLAVMMLLSVASVAMADDYTDTETVTITKVYELEGAGISPAETFNFTIEPGTVTDAADGVTAANMPMPTIGNVSYAAGEAGSANKSKNITITLPTYTSVGIYTYIIKETANNIAGVTYYGGDIQLKVTVIEQDGKIRVAAVHTEDGFNGTTEAGTKKDSFENKYTANQLTVTKVVAGKLGDRTKTFYFKATFTSDKEVKSDVTYGNQKLIFTKGEDGKYTATATFTLNGSNANQMTFANLPKGVTYTVVELSGENGTELAAGALVDGKYTVSYDNAKTGTMDKDALSTTITNTYEGTIDMGVMLDSMPYVLVLAVVGAAVIALIAKKRRAED